MANKPTYEALEERVRQLEQSDSIRERAEKALQASEAKLREAQRLAGLGYWHWDVRTGNVIVHRGILNENVNFLQKPFSIDSLATKVREVLDH
jgi:uncharacterized protein YdhG (YjbR/CyaY superfamily)